MARLRLLSKLPSVLLCSGSAGQPLLPQATARRAQCTVGLGKMWPALAGLASANKRKHSTGETRWGPQQAWAAAHKEPAAPKDTGKTPDPTPASCPACTTLGAWDLPLAHWMQPHDGHGHAPGQALTRWQWGMLGPSTHLVAVATMGEQCHTQPLPSPTPSLPTPLGFPPLTDHSHQNVPSGRTR